MAKKIKKVVVSEAYLTLLERKATLLDSMFEARGRIAVHSDNFKDFVKLDKLSGRIGDTSVSPYEG